MSNFTLWFKKVVSQFVSWLRLFIQGTNRPGLKGKNIKLPRRAYTLASIDIEWLKKCGIRGIILDLDNTLVSEDDRYLSPKAED
jgi:hypothetical protein